MLRAPKGVTTYESLELRAQPPEEGKFDPYAILQACPRVCELSAASAQHLSPSARASCALGSNPRYQILSHVFARCVSRAILAWPCVFWLAQRAKKCDTNHIPRATAYCAPPTRPTCQPAPPAPPHPPPSPRALGPSTSATVTASLLFKTRVMADDK